VKAARAALAEEHARRGRGEKITADPRLRFDDAAAAWWEARAVKLRPATQNAYGAGLRHLSGYFGRRRLSDIGPGDVARFVAQQQRAGLKGWTIRGQLTVLGLVFRYAARYLGFVGANPVALLDRGERPGSDDDDDDEKAKHILGADDLRRLLDNVTSPTGASLIWRPRPADAWAKCSA
jgi:site-specific recombinase XerD